LQIAIRCRLRPLGNRKAVSPQAAQILSFDTAETNGRKWADWRQAAFGCGSTKADVPVMSNADAVVDNLATETDQLSDEANVLTNKRQP